MPRLKFAQALAKPTLDLYRAVEQPFLFVDLQCSQTAGYRKDVTRMCVAHVEELSIEEARDVLPHEYPAQRDVRRAGALCEGKQIRRHVQSHGRKGLPHPAKSRHHLVEREQDAVSVADGAQALEIAWRINDKATRSRHRFDH